MVKNRVNDPVIGPNELHGALRGSRLGDAPVCTDESNSAIRRQGERPLATHRTGEFLLVSRDLSGLSELP